MKTGWIALACLLLLLPVSAQESLGTKDYVKLLSVSPVSLGSGKSGTVSLSFRIVPGFHINSNKPKAEYLIPTTLKLSPPTDISLAKITYPAGQEETFPFAPDEKMSVYAGDFVLTAKVLAIGSVHPGTYRVHGELRYQACDKSACYPPRSLPLNIDIRVQRAAHRRGYR